MNHGYHVTSVLFEPSDSSCPLSLSPAHEVFRCLPVLWPIMGNRCQELPRLQPLDNLKLLYSKAKDLSSLCGGGGNVLSGSWTLFFRPIEMYKHRFTPPTLGTHIQPTGPRGKVDVISFCTSHSISDPLLNKTLFSSREF